MEENECKQISEGLNKVSQEYLKFYTESMNRDHIAPLKKDIDKIERPIGSLKLGKFLFPLRKKYTKDMYAHHKKLERMWDEEYAFIHEINEKTSKESLSQQEIGELENKLTDFEEKFKDPCISPQYWVYELRFQLPEFVNKSLKEGYLDVPSADIRSFNVNVLNYFIGNLTKYAKRYEKQSKDLINKAAEVYKIDNERGRKERRRVGPMFITTGCGSTASECLGLIRRLGNALGWSEEKTYSFVGMTKQEIEENEKEWGKKLKSLSLEY